MAICRVNGEKKRGVLAFETIKAVPTKLKLLVCERSSRIAIQVLLIEKNLVGIFTDWFAPIIKKRDRQKIGKMGLELNFISTLKLRNSLLMTETTSYLDGLPLLQEKYGSLDIFEIIKGSLNDTFILQVQI